MPRVVHLYNKKTRITEHYLIEIAKLRKANGKTNCTSQYDIH